MLIDLKRCRGRDRVLAVRPPSEAAAGRRSSTEVGWSEHAVLRPRPRSHRAGRRRGLQHLRPVPPHPCAPTPRRSSRASCSGPGPTRVAWTSSAAWPTSCPTGHSPSCRGRVSAGRRPRPGSSGWPGRSWPTPEIWPGSRATTSSGQRFVGSAHAWWHLGIHAESAEAVAARLRPFADRVAFPGSTGPFLGTGGPRPGQARRPRRRRRRSPSLDRRRRRHLRSRRAPDVAGPRLADEAELLARSPDAGERAAAGEVRGRALAVAEAAGCVPVLRRLA